MLVRVSEAWRQAFPDAHAGVLVLDNVHNGVHSAELDRYLSELQARLLRVYAGLDRAALANLPTIRAYQHHYRSFGQTYHLLGQLESVVLKGRPVASRGGTLVTAMFAAEMDNLVLTAGHDVHVLVGDLELDCSRAGEQYVGIGGREHTLKAGDMLMRDGDSVISAVLSGPDERTRLLPSTSRALYVSYAPHGIDVTTLRQHLEDIARLVRLAQPAARVEQLEIYPA
jgi:DNA/RNA-binding domain of Phe-tRNA-synthetase-like protein